MRNINETRLFLLITVMHKYAEELYFQGKTFRNLCDELEAILRPPPAVFVTTTSLAVPVQKLIIELQQEKHRPHELIILALLRNTISLPENKRPSVDTVLQFLWNSNVFLDPSSASRGASTIWDEIKADLGQSEIDTRSTYFLDLSFKDGTARFSWNGEQLFFLNPEELTRLNLEIKNEGLYRIDEQDPEPIESPGNFGNVDDVLRNRED